MTNDIARTMQPIRGLRPAEYEVFKSGGLWDPKTGLPVPEPDAPAPEDDG